MYSLKNHNKTAGYPAYILFFHLAVDSEHFPMPLNILWELEYLAAWYSFKGCIIFYLITLTFLEI